jgi:uncharacterized protein (TIGR03000 family)
MRSKLWIVGLTALILASSASAQWRGRGWGRPGAAVNYWGNYNSPYYGSYYGYSRPYYYNGFYRSYSPGYRSYVVPAPVAYSTPVYAPTYYYPPATTYYPSVNSSNDSAFADATPVSSNYFDPTADPPKLTILLPTADAQLWISGNSMADIGMTREFWLPSLEMGRTYLYTFRTTWTKDGRSMERTKEVTFQGGQAVTVDLRESASPAPLAAPPASTPLK